MLARGSHRGSRAHAPLLPTAQQTRCDNHKPIIMRLPSTVFSLEAATGGRLGGRLGGMLAERPITICACV